MFDVPKRLLRKATRVEGHDPDRQTELVTHVQEHHAFRLERGRQSQLASPPPVSPAQHLLRRREFQFHRPAKDAEIAVGGRAGELENGAAKVALIHVGRHL